MTLVTAAVAAVVVRPVSITVPALTTKMIVFVCRTATMSSLTVTSTSAILAVLRGRRKVVLVGEDDRINEPGRPSRRDDLFPRQHRLPFGKAPRRPEIRRRPHPDQHLAVQ
ncbi:MAG TPA: hypothetical protein VH333_17975 [Pseudonocardiaceae bacterium]|nr:hypothetical protein [Pseudonocardiaceae bacterium]